MELIDVNVCDVPKYIPEFVHLGYSKIPNAGLGVFATTRIKQGTFMGNYMGEILDSADEMTTNEYLYGTYSRTKKFTIDASSIEKSNYTRFINCCSANYNENLVGIRYTPSEGSSVYRTRTGKQIDIDGYIFFYATRDIEQGEELYYDYGEAYRKKLGI